VSTPARQTAIHDLVIELHREPGRERLALSGELDLASSWNLVEAVSRLCREGAKAIVLDIGGLDFVDSTGLRAILTSRARCAEAQCAITIIPESDRIRPQVRRLFQVTGLLDRLPFAAPGQG
jgi:anti-sigma B factor antagonist